MSGQPTRWAGDPSKATGRLNTEPSPPDRGPVGPDVNKDHLPSVTSPIRNLLPQITELLQRFGRGAAAGLELSRGARGHPVGTALPPRFGRAKGNRRPTGPRPSGAPLQFGGVDAPVDHPGSGRPSRSAANREAVAHLRRAEEVLRTLPEPERIAQEVELLTVLGPALLLTHGYGAPEVEQAYARARELCRHVDDNPGVFFLLSRLWRYHQGR